MPLARLRPAVVNDVIYNPVDPAGPAIRAEAEGLRETVDRFGIGAMDPLVVTLDDVIVSGHRRRAMLLALGMGDAAVPVNRLPLRSTDPDFERVLVRYNAQRDKDPAELVREQLVLSDPDDAYQALLSHRVEKAKVRAPAIPLGERRKRDRITRAKKPLLDAVLAALRDLEDYLPVTDRQLFYHLLNDPPLIHASKPDSRFANNRASYKATTDIATRGRLVGLIPFDAIGDETRPVEPWAVYPSVGPFVAEQAAEFLTRYYRDLMVGQPNHVEIVGEKMTVEGTIRPVASDFCVPYTIGRGYASLPPRKAMADRFRASGKARLVLLFLTDFDPEGQDIPSSFALSMRDDFGIPDVHPIKVGLTAEQVRSLDLKPNYAAKTKSSRFKKFAARYGPHAYELEAVHPERLRTWLREAIASVIDVDVSNRQVEQERWDAATIAAIRKAAVEYLRRLAI